MSRTDEMIIRTVTRSDVDAWLALRCALWPDTAREEHRREIDGFFAGTIQEPQAVLVAQVDERIVGFAELSIRPYAEGCRSGHVAFLEGWYVAPDHRRHGIGRALVCAAERWGRSQGCAEFASDTEMDNQISRLAHHRCGFTEVAVIRCFRKALS